MTNHNHSPPKELTWWNKKNQRKLFVELRLAHSASTSRASSPNLDIWKTYTIAAFTSHLARSPLAFPSLGRYPKSRDCGVTEPPRHKLTPTSAPVSKISAWSSANPGLFGPTSSPEPGIVEQRKSLGGAAAHLNDMRFSRFQGRILTPPPYDMTAE